MTFGERLRQIRRDRHVSQRSLALQCGVDFTYISKIERGNTPAPSEETLGKMVQALGAQELFYLAGKIPYQLKMMARDNSKLAELLVCLSTKTLPDEIYQEMITLARKKATDDQTQ